MAGDQPQIRPCHLTAGKDAHGLPILEAYIKVGEDKLKIYSEERPDECSKGYIISEIGQTYVIGIIARSAPAEQQAVRCEDMSCPQVNRRRVVHNHDYPEFGCFVFIDGHLVGGRCLMRAPWSKLRDEQLFSTVDVAAGGSGRPSFSAPTLQEDIARLPAEKVKDIGTIRVIFIRASYIGPGEEKLAIPHGTAAPSGVHKQFGPINEKDKKAQSACVTEYKDLQRSNSVRETADGFVRIINEMQWHPDDSMDRPYYTFEFVYRPRDLLQADGKLNDGEYEDAHRANLSVQPAEVVDLTGSGKRSDIKDPEVKDEKPDILHKGKRSRRVVIDVPQISDGESSEHEEEIVVVRKKKKSKSGADNGSTCQQDARMNQQSELIEFDAVYKKPTVTGEIESKRASQPDSLRDTRQGLKDTYSGCGSGIIANSKHQSATVPSAFGPATRSRTQQATAQEGVTFLKETLGKTGGGHREE